MHIDLPKVLHGSDSYSRKPSGSTAPSGDFSIGLHCSQGKTEAEWLLSENQHAHGYESHAVDGTVDWLSYQKWHIK